MRGPGGIRDQRFPLTEDYVSELVRANTDFIGFSLSGAPRKPMIPSGVNSHLPD